MKKIRQRNITLLGLMLSIILLFEVYIYLPSLTMTPKKSDVIVILGCQIKGTRPTLFLRERTQRAIALYREGYAEMIMVSGGKGRGESMTEAKAEQHLLLAAGIPAEHIIIEDRSTNTAIQIKAIKQLMQQHDMKTAIIVSNKSHLRRASMLAQRYNLDATYSGVFVWDRLEREIYSTLREIPAILKDLVYSEFGN